MGEAIQIEVLMLLCLVYRSLMIKGFTYRVRMLPKMLDSIATTCHKVFGWNEL